MRVEINPVIFWVLEPMQSSRVGNVGVHKLEIDRV